MLWLRGFSHVLNEARKSVKRYLYYLVFGFFQCLGVLSTLQHQLSLLLFQVWSLVLHGLAQQLVLQALGCNHKIQQCNLHCNLHTDQVKGPFSDTEVTT